MSTRSFKRPTIEPTQIKDALAYHVRQVAAELRQKGLVASSLTVILKTARHGDFAHFGGSNTVILPKPVSDTATLLSLALRQCDTLYQTQVPYNKTGLIIHGLLPVAFVSQTLFPSSQTSKVIELDALIDTVSARLGRDTLKLGYFTKEPDWQAKRDLLSPAYTTQWSAIPLVGT